ncbi:hypothetical protein PR048_011375 [Dryococelus australis]|uniref:Uncharacterized protein n=1 Tax=Dryococelus australis TaxID=614101 RepID=A0ABQ9HLE4_9NEOP|nr:hypothetical protein PR048_011375 [Dryococelus australis]
MGDDCGSTDGSIVSRPFISFNNIPSNLSHMQLVEVILVASHVSPPKEAIVAEQLACSPPAKANRVQSLAGSPDFRKWESCHTMPLVGGFSQGYPISPAPSFRCHSIFTSISLIGSQDLAMGGGASVMPAMSSLSVIPLAALAGGGRTTRQRGDLIDGEGRLKVGHHPSIPLELNRA